MRGVTTVGCATHHVVPTTPPSSHTHHDHHHHHTHHHHTHTHPNQVLAPYDSEDARGLLKAAIRDDDPVVFLENEILYGEAFPVSDAVLDKDFTVPIGKAKVQREGTDVTLIAFGRMVGHCLQAAEQLAKEGINAEVYGVVEGGCGCGWVFFVVVKRMHGMCFCLCV